jgi:hypothetical protein
MTGDHSSILLVRKIHGQHAHYALRFAENLFSRNGKIVQKNRLQFLLRSSRLKR